MERFVYKKLREFDMKKNYKLFRLFQKLANPKFNKRRSYKDVKIDLLTRKVKVRVFTPPKNNNRLGRIDEEFKKYIYMVVDG